MADPVTIGMIGAGAGAMLDRDNPLRGAAIGGLGGWGGGTLAGVGAAGVGPAGAGAANNALYGALPGINQGSQQAAMLAAQTAEFGTPGLMATGAAASPAGSLPSAAFSLGNKLSSVGGADPSNLMQAGAMLRPEQQPAMQPQMGMPPAMPQRGQPAPAPRPYGQPGQSTQIFPAIDRYGGMELGSPFSPYRGR